MIPVVGGLGSVVIQVNSEVESGTSLPTLQQIVRCSAVPCSSLRPIVEIVFIVPRGR